MQCGTNMIVLISSHNELLMAETSKPEEDKIESHLGVIDYFYPAVDNIDSEIEIYRELWSRSSS